MTRSEAYADGWHQGRRWAEEDLANSAAVDAIAQELKDWYGRSQVDVGRARALGVIRGYRQTIEDFVSGRITRKTFEHAPLGGGDA